MDAYEDQSMRSWFRTLDPDIRTQIRALHQLKMSSNFIFVYLALVWAGTAFIMHLFPYWPIWLIGYGIIGLVLHGYGNFMHEGIHGNLFRNSGLDRWAGFLGGIPTFVSPTAYRVVHMLHHRYNRTENDPDDLNNISPDPFFRRLFYYLWLFFGIFVYIYIRIPHLAMKHGNKKERRQILVEYLLMAVILTGAVVLAFRYGFTGALLHYWLIPILFCGLFANLRGWAEHMLTEHGHPLKETRTVTSNRVLSFLNLNLNYHLEHHLFPAIPWYNLPRVHQLLLEEYQNAGAVIYGSYIRFFFDAVRNGIHGFKKELEAAHL